MVHGRQPDVVRAGAQGLLKDNCRTVPEHAGTCWRLLRICLGLPHFWPHNSTTHCLLMLFASTPHRHYYYSAECFLREFAPNLRRT